MPLCAREAHKGTVDCMKVWRTPLCIAALGVIASGVVPSVAGAVLTSLPSSTPTEAASTGPQHTSSGQQRLTLLEREAAIWSAEATLISKVSSPLQKSLPSIERQLKNMRAQVATLQKQIAVSKKAAVGAVIDQFVSGYSEQSLPLLVNPKNAAQNQTNAVYLGVVMHSDQVLISRYQALQKKASKRVSTVEAQISVIASTIPHLRLNSAALVLAAKGASSAAQQLSSVLASPLALSANDALNVEGKATLSAAEMAGWWRSMGYTNNSGVSILALAKEYLKAGNAEGVAGDVAFAQAILETGGFSAMSGSNNFAGIGACNSCNGGYNYASYVQGVRAQIQLLHAYADKKLTNAQLVGGASYQGVDTLSVRGCCVSWPKLSKVWSTGPHYGEIILGIYTRMLQWAVAHLPAAK
jgi:hypothetical protein